MTPTTIYETVSAECARLCGRLADVQAECERRGRALRSYERKFGAARHKSCVVITHRKDGRRQYMVDAWLVIDDCDTVNNSNYVRLIYDHLATAVGVTQSQTEVVDTHDGDRYDRQG